MTKSKRRHRSAEEKARLLRRHLVDKVPVSTICEEEKLQPSVWYGWHREMLARLETTLASKPGKRNGREMDLERRVAKLEAKLARKDSVIAEISEEYVTLKKELGEL
ncbi:MAG TPA: transposase [Nannocystis exedens]|nr:transposase [Nannocystis exedens]